MLIFISLLSKLFWGSCSENWLEQKIKPSQPSSTCQNPLICFHWDQNICSKDYDTKLWTLIYYWLRTHQDDFSGLNVADCSYVPSLIRIGVKRVRKTVKTGCLKNKQIMDLERLYSPSINLVWNYLWPILFLSNFLKRIRSFLGSPLAIYVGWHCRYQSIDIFCSKISLSILNLNLNFNYKTI